MSESTALAPIEESENHIQLLWNDRINKYEAIDLRTGQMCATYTAKVQKIDPRSISYTPDMGDRVIDCVRRGASLTKIAKDPTMPPVSAIYLWRSQNPEFKRRLEMAYKDRAENYHDEAIEIAMSAVHSPKEMQAGLKLAVSTLQWAAEKGNPDRYGSKKETGGHAGGVTVIIDTGVRTKQSMSVGIEVDANGEFKGFIDEQAHRTVRGSESTRPEPSDGEEGTIIELGRDRWRETESGAEASEGEQRF